MPKANTDKEQLTAHMKQAHGRASSASLGRDADAWRGHWEQTAQQDTARPSVCIEYNLGSMSGGHKKKGTVVKQIIVSFKRKPPEELCRNCLTHTTCRQAPLRRASLPQQQDDLEDREIQQPENEGQCFSRRQSGGLYGRPGQVGAKDGMRQPKTGRDRSMSFPWTTRQQPQVVYVNFTKGTMSKQEALECLEAHTATSEPVALAEEEEREEGVGKKLSQEERWEDSISRQLDLKLSMSEATAAETPAGHTYRSPSLTVIDALAHERRTSFQKAPRALHRASTATESRRSSRSSLSPEEQEKQHARDCTPALLDTAQYITGEVVHKAVTVIQEPSEQTEEQQDLEDSMDVSLVTPAGAEDQTPAPNSSTNNGLLDTAQYITDGVVHKAVTVIQEPSEQTEEQQDVKDSMDVSLATLAGVEDQTPAPDNPTDDAPALLDTAQYITGEVVHKAVTVIQESSEQTEEQQDLEDSADVSLATSTGAEDQTPAPDSSTGNGLLDTAQYIKGGVVRKAVTVIQEPSEQTEEQQDLEDSADVSLATSTGAEDQTPAPDSSTNNGLLDTAQYIKGGVVRKAVTVIQEPSEQTEVQQDLEDSMDVSLATPAGAEDQTPAPDSPTDDALLDTAQYIKGGVVRKAVIVTQGPEEQTEEQQDLDQNMDEVTKATTEETESPADTPHSPTEDAPVLLDTDEYNRTKVLGKGVIAIQGTKQQPEELRDLEQSTDEVTRATATAAGAEIPRHIPHTVPHSPTDDAPVLLDTAQYIRTEVVRKAVIMTQAPVLQLEEQWNREGSMDEVMAATATTAEVTESPVYAPNCPTPDASTLLDTFQYIRNEVQGKATLLVRSPEQQPEEQQDLEQGVDEVVRATATAAGAESPAHALHSPTDNAPILLNTDEYNRTEVLGKGVIVIQGTNQQPEELKDLKQSTGEVMRATATAAEAEVLAHTLHSPTGNAPALLDTAQDIRGKVMGKAALNSSLKSSKQRPKVQQNLEKGTDNMLKATATAAQTAPTARRTAGPEKKYGRGTGRTNLLSRTREPSKRPPKPHS
ncbi:uncharacterized protein LOC114000933 isoform X2 [Pipra filicauda]|uniref:Uncharacterized protein LOC114000933 isoform X2 n=1 Tax=Pipra filicauda TaxID=649802 RepID=A0A7R5L744_9PASS|nr:uncharacterized protein LOC114000933 isoform X2 [Pipra filicauda]